MELRRKLIMLIALAPVLKFQALAQPARTWRVGILSIRPRPASLEHDFQYGPFLKALRELGYVEGKNIAFEWRFASGKYDALPALAADLVRHKVDVIAVVNVPVIRAAQQATKTIPIVMLSASDPVAAGFVSSLARPGGNITGFSSMNVDLSQKHLELLRTIISNLSRAAFLLNPANSATVASLKAIQKSAESVGIKILPIEAMNSQQLGSAFATAARENVSALIVSSDSIFLDLRQEIVDLTFRHRIPAIFPQRVFVEAGGLMSYGGNYDLRYGHAATYVDKILKGAKPADLPIEMNTTLQLVINRKAAASFGLEIPPQLLMRADEVIG